VSRTSARRAPAAWAPIAFTSARARRPTWPRCSFSITRSFSIFLAGAEGALEERGYLFHNDFVIFDEAHTLESVAARHLGLEISHGSLRYLLHRLFHPRTQKGIVAALHNGRGDEAGARGGG